MPLLPVGAFYTDKIDVGAIAPSAPPPLLTPLKIIPVCIALYLTTKVKRSYKYLVIVEKVMSVLSSYLNTSLTTPCSLFPLCV